MTNINNNYQNRNINLDEKISSMQSASMGTEYQSGNALIKFKFAESVANSLSRGGYAGYNIASMYRINPFLDMGADFTGINKGLDWAASKIGLGNANLTNGFNLTNNVGLRWITSDTVSKAGTESAEKNLMKGLNITFGQNSGTNLFSVINEKFFQGNLKNPLSGNSTINALKTKTKSMLTHKGTKATMGVLAKGLSVANTYMLWETAFDFAEMYNEHLMQKNIDKSINYNSQLTQNLNTETVLNSKNHILQNMNNSNNELNYILSTVNTAEKYFGG